MDLASMDMKKEYAFYNEAAPMHTAQILGKRFRYRYYKNPSPKVGATIVMLAGGTGLAEGFFGLARDFMERYSLIVFNYPMDFKGNEATADAVAELLRTLQPGRVYLWGQSYGGLLAQIIAKRHPDVVTGLLLTSTASLSSDLKFAGMARMVEMLNEEKERKNDRSYQRLPMSLLPPLMTLAFKKHLKGNPKAYEAIRELLKQIRQDMTKDYFRHMNALLGDLRNHMGTHHREDFTYLKGHVLIIAPEDDATFTPDIKDALIDLMPEPVVIRENMGGHLAMMLDTDAFMKIINDFMDGQG